MIRVFNTTEAVGTTILLDRDCAWQSTPFKGRVVRVVVLLTCWAVAVGIGFHTMLNYQLTPGSIGNPPDQWPGDSLVSLHPHIPTLLIFAHPKCPCTAATMTELERLMAVNQHRVSTHVIFLKAANVADWEKTDLWHRAVGIPQVNATCDEGGQFTRRFGIETSGTAVLYDTNGHQIFRGGITSSRGHEGDNLGASAIGAYLLNGEIGCSSTPVFGCAMRSSSSKET